MSNNEISYDQVMEYCRSRNYALIDREFLHIVLGDEPMELWGLSIEDVKRVIEIYKYKGVVQTTEYTEGFEDGLNYMKTYYEKVMDELIKNVVKEENDDSTLVTLEDDERWEEQEELDMQMVRAEEDE